MNMAIIKFDTEWQVTWRHDAIFDLRFGASSAFGPPELEAGLARCVAERTV
jgi:hypothetical protein